MERQAACLTHGERGQTAGVEWERALGQGHAIVTAVQGKKEVGERETDPQVKEGTQRGLESCLQNGQAVRPLLSKPETPNPADAPSARCVGTARREGRLQWASRLPPPLQYLCWADPREPSEYVTKNVNSVSAGEGRRFTLSCLPWLQGNRGELSQTAETRRSPPSALAQTKPKSAVSNRS